MVASRPLELSFGTPLEVLDRGTSMPVSALMNGPDGSLTEWVVKPPHPLRPSSLLAEALGSDLCRVLHVGTPDSAIAVLPESPVFNDETAAGQRMNDIVKQSPGGLVYCSRLSPNPVEHAPGAFKHREPKDVLRLFFADAFMWNFDRTSGKPNLIWDAHRLVAIDHGHAFSGIEAIQENGLPTHDWSAQRNDRWVDHVATKYLSQQFRSDKLVKQDVADVAEPLVAAEERLVELLGRWPSSMSPLGFKEDLERFLLARLSVLSELQDAVHEAFHKR